MSVLIFQKLLSVIQPWFFLFLFCFVWFLETVFHVALEFPMRPRLAQNSLFSLPGTWITCVDHYSQFKLHYFAPFMLLKHKVLSFWNKTYHLSCLFRSCIEELGIQLSWHTTCLTSRHHQFDAWYQNNNKESGLWLFIEVCSMSKSRY